MTLKTGHIEGVNFARIIGALGIVIFHFTCHCELLKPYLYGTPNYSYGKLWVALFFAISGACIARSNTDTPWETFFKKRWLGIFPVFYIAYIIMFALKWLVYGCWWTGLKTWTIVLTFLGIDSYFYYLQSNFCCVGEWFIGALLACYLLFPVLQKALKYIPIITAVILLIGCCFIPYLPCFTIKPWQNIWVCVTTFYIGALLAQYPLLFSSKISFAISALLTFTTILFPLPFKQFVPLADIVYPVLSGVCCFIFLTQLGALCERPVIANKIFKHLGQLAYPIFLIQHTVIYMVLYICPVSTLPASVGLLCANIIITLLLAELILYIWKKLQVWKKSQAYFILLPLLIAFIGQGCTNFTKQKYIAHAGGCIYRYLYSNSLEAVNNALDHNMKYIELDLSVTSDGQLVAWHDWQFEWTETPTHDEFMARKIYGRFTPIDFPRLDSILTANQRLSLVTDKLSDPAVIDKWLQPYKKRVWIECFSDDDYFALQQMGYHVLLSQVPPYKSEEPALIRNYTFNYLHCSDLSDRDGDTFALFGGQITQSLADSLFETDPRIRFIYIDFYE